MKRATGPVSMITSERRLNAIWPTILPESEAHRPLRLHPQRREKSGYWQSLLYPMDSILTRWETVIVSEEKAQSIRNGALISFPENPELMTSSEHCRAYTWDGNLLGILHFDAEKQLWQPEKVFN